MFMVYKEFQKQKPRSLFPFPTWEGRRFHITASSWTAQPQMSRAGNQKQGG